MARLIEIIRSHPYLDPAWVPDILLVAPPPPIHDAAGEITDRERSEARALPASYAALAAERGTGFFDGGTVTTGALPDGVHLSAEGSRALGEAMVDVVRARLSQPQAPRTG